MIFLEIEFGSEIYREECELRHQVLRVPLGLSLRDEDLSDEWRQMHFGLMDDGVLVACVIAVGLSSTSAKIRQMVVGDAHQGRGCGRIIIRCMEERLGALGFVHLSMHARMSAAGFYEKLGYVKTGGEFLEVGIPHIKMEKHLTTSRTPGGGN